MEMITELTTYRNYKRELDNELQKSADSFVRIGYLLKLARDTDILMDSPYDNVIDFAQAEYGIDKTLVSRWIRINDRFSEGGNSDRLKEGYREYGYAKLAIMLQLPDSVNDELTPGYSKKEIQAIKDETDEERNISDIEVYLENREETGVTNMDKALHQLLMDDTKLYTDLYTAAKEGEDIIEVLAPQGECYISVRVAGIGRFALIINESDTVSLTNIRSGDKEVYKKAEIVDYIKSHTTGDSAKEAYEKEYNREYVLTGAEVIGKVRKTVKNEKQEKTQKRQDEKPAKPVNAPVESHLEAEKAKVAPVQPEKSASTGTNTRSPGFSEEPETDTEDSISDLISNILETADKLNLTLTDYEGREMPENMVAVCIVNIQDMIKDIEFLQTQLEDE